MTARMWFCFIAPLAIIASLNASPNEKKATWLDLGKVTVESNIAVKNAIWLDSGKVTVKGNYITVNMHPERKVKTAISDIRKKLKSLHQDLSALEKLKGTNVALIQLEKRENLSLKRSKTFTKELQIIQEKAHKQIDRLNLKTLN